MPSVYFCNRNFCTTEVKKCNMALTCFVLLQAIDQGKYICIYIKEGEGKKMFNEDVLM